MTESGSHVYCDDATHAALSERGAKVLLLGSYGGFSNFGDVLQLKGAIAWHRSRSGLEPVAFCHTTAVPDAGFCERQRSWLGVRAIVYWSPDLLDMSAAGLHELTDAIAFSHLHVYGGGFLNRFWGAGTLASIERVIERFGVGHYVMSGQQIDPLIVPELREHFRRHTPLLAGGRDPESAGLLAACGVESADSFDDSAEVLRDFVATNRTDERGDADLLLHLNVSYYTGADRLDRAAAVLDQFAGALRSRAAGREPRVVLLHAYGDRRTDEVIDTLGAVSTLEDRFPFLRFESLELGLYALHAGRPDAPRPAIPRAPLALSSSYHVSILLSLLGVPCHMLAANAYYEQKREGLGGDGDVDAFLKAPRKMDLASRFTLREAWMQRLAEAYVQPPAARDPNPVANTTVAARVWRPKSRMIEVVSEELRQSRVQCDELAREMETVSARSKEHAAYVETLKAEIEKLWSDSQGLAAGFEERGRVARDLERENAGLRTALESMRVGFEERGQHLTAVEAKCCKLWDDLQELAKGFEDRGRIVRESEESCKRLWEDNQRLERLLAEQTTEASRLREELAQRWWHRFTRGARHGATRR
jgi:hypothetical protein